MKANRIVIPMVALLFAVVLALPGCGNSEAKSKVEEAVGVIAATRSVQDDLMSLNQRLNALGTRSSNVEDTIAEGKSLVEIALMDLDELETDYARARDILREVESMDGAGDYAEYARLALAALETESEALAVNRLLLTSVWDMLDVLPMAESQEQLSYYVEEIDSLTTEVNDLLQQGAAEAAEADRYYREEGL
ncbi:MAG: hypothetical protein AB1384_05150 [Actinomycetota bacterium]